MASRIASSSPRARAAALAALAAAILIVVLPASSAAVRPPFLACLVTGVGGPEDESFNQLAVTGLHAAETRGVVGRVVRGTSQADYVQELSSCAQNGAGITIGVGYELATAVDQTATMFPRAAFAIVDVDVRTLTHRPANVEGLVFKQQEAGYLAGLHRRAVGREARRQGGRLDRRPRHPAGRSCARRVPVRRQAGEPGPHRAERLLRRFRRAGEVPGAGTGADRQRIRGRVPGCRALRCRGILRGPGEGHLRDRLRCRPVLVRPIHTDERALASRRRRRGRGARRALGAVGGRHQRGLRGRRTGASPWAAGAPAWASRSAGRWRASSRS